MASAQKGNGEVLNHESKRYWLLRPAGFDPSCGFDLPEEIIGPFNNDQLVRIVFKSERYTGDCSYRVDGENEWIPLRSFAHLEWAEPLAVKMESLRSVRIHRVKWLASQIHSECDICTELDGKVFSIDAPPVVPPSGCR